MVLKLLNVTDHGRHYVNQIKVRGVLDWSEQRRKLVAFVLAHEELLEVYVWP